MEDSKLGIGMYRRTESSNASLLVQAALDAAEREIGAVSSPPLMDRIDTDREANLYISNELACSQSQVHRSPPNMDSYMQEELATSSPSVTPHPRHTPPGHMHLDYHSIHRPVDYVRPSHSIEQYLDQQELQRVIHVPQEVMPTSPTRYQEVIHHPHHPLHLHHQIQDPGGMSSDEGDSVAQNLSLTSVKEKIPKYDTLEPDFLMARDRMRFEPLIVQSAERDNQGLDMSARAFNHHHHPLYDMSERERQGVDLSRTSSEAYPGSFYSHVDSRSHHLHTSVSRIIASPQPPMHESLDARIMSPPLPPNMPGYNAGGYAVGPTSYHAARPGYHYSGYY